MQAKILGECVGVVGFRGVDRKQCARVCIDEWIDVAKFPTEFAERLFWLMPQCDSRFHQAARFSAVKVTAKSSSVINYGATAKKRPILV